MLVLYILVCSLAKVTAHFPGDHTPKEARWCCVNEKEIAKCQDLARVVTAVQSNLSISMNVTCVRGTNVTHCMSLISRNKADLVTLSEEDIYKAGKKYGLVPVVGEQSGREPRTSYYAVALVLSKASPSLSLKSLKGATSCHPRAGDTAGWQVPIGFLIANHQMTWKSCSTFLSAGAFFKKSCVPGTFTPENNPLRDNPRNLCGLCLKEDCPPGKSERYYGYQGSYQCLVQGRADVIFVRHTTVFEFTGILNELNPGDAFRLLCPDGTRKDVGEYKSCNLARIPASVVMTKDAGKEQFRARGYRLLLLELDNYLKNNKQTFHLFNSTRYGGADLLFHDSTLNFADVGERNTTDRWLGESYKRVLDALNSCHKIVKSAPKSNDGQIIVLLWSCHVLVIVVISKLQFLW